MGLGALGTDTVKLSYRPTQFVGYLQAKHTCSLNICRLRDEDLEFAAVFSIM